MGVNVESTTAPAPNGTDAWPHAGKLGAWCGLVAVITAFNYAGNYAIKTSKAETNRALFHYSTAVGSVVVYVVMFSIVLAIANDRRDLFAWRRPTMGWLRALGLAAITLIVAGLIISFVDQWLHGGREQGVVPPHWISGHTGAYVANWIVIAGVAPFVEESTYRGLGYSLLRRFGVGVAITGTGVAFALSHGLLRGLPELCVFGLALAWLRSRVDSTFPGMLVHCAFNSFALAAVFWS
jgi:membrane protease YdiL (CAAX protease family)